MASWRVAPPVVVIVGPTASGKTAAALELAEKYRGEIICADSRTLYKGMDIGTAKPTLEERARVPHYGLDLVEPGAVFSVADFKSYALQKIDEIRGRGRVPIVVGGSGLYIDAIVFDYTFGGRVDTEMRERYEKMTVNELQDYCIKNNIQLPENYHNKRYLTRAIERHGNDLKRRMSPSENFIVVGIATKNKDLRRQIVRRSEQLFNNGVVDEAKKLGEKYGWNSEAMTGNIYPLVQKYATGDVTVAEMQARFVTLDWRLAKRQMTWFRRNPFIEWCDKSDIIHYIGARLESEH